jgi:hypothetical protein
VVPLRRRHTRALVTLGAALAAAALVVLGVRLGREPAAGGAVIESVDFGGTAGVIFQVHGAQTTVLWQTTDHEGEESR